MNHCFQRNGQSSTVLSPLALRVLLAITLSVGLTTLACSNSTNSVSELDTSATAIDSETDSVGARADSTTDKSNQSTATVTTNAEPSTPNSEVYAAEVGNDGEPDEPLTANIERLELESGTLYGEVRSLVMAAGWVPYTQSEGASPDIDTITVQEMHNLGFEEAQSCSGTGQGFCTFEFTHVNREAFPAVRLVIITTPSMDELYGEPNFYDWRIDNDEPEASRNTTVSHNTKDNSSSSLFLEANATYETQKFDATLYAEVLAQEQDCVLIGDCANSRYLFEDVLLVFSPGEYGSITMTVIPPAPVSRPQALNYAQILDTDNEIDFTDSSIVDNNEGELPSEAVSVTESFFEANLPADGVAYERGSAKMVRLISQPGENISQVEFELVVF